MRPDDASRRDVTTLLHGATQCLAHDDGGIEPHRTTGIFHRDVRLVSGLVLEIDGTPRPLLTAHRTGPDVSDQVFALDSDAHDSPTALLHRRRTVGPTVVDRYDVHAYEVPVRSRLVLRYEHDLVSVLDVKDHRPGAPKDPELRADGWDVAGDRFGVQVRADGDAEVEAGELAWQLDLAPGQTWSATVQHVPTVDGQAVGADRAVEPSRLALATADTRWSTAVRSAIADRDALRITVPELGLSYLGAGVPWFMALFGRDTLLTALESMIAGPEVGLDVAEALAHYQGRRHDPPTAEQPGRILHELRTGGAEVFGVPSGVPYYGTVDASPLFVMLLGELHRWGADPARVGALLPAAREAVRWCLEHGDVDGDGFVEYVADADGLVNQGWKDSGDALVHADGSQAEGPIALAEVQAYLHRALLDLAALERAHGQPQRAPDLEQQASRLRERFTEAFWLPEQRLVAMALDGTKTPLAVASSNLGHVLWAGVLADGPAREAAARLAEPDLTTAWGVRTLGAEEVAYSPLSYHRGSVWPHDSALCAWGLARAGRPDVADRVGAGLLQAAERFDWRLPELLGGQGADEVPFPVPYPVACSPQAWSASVPLLLLRLALGLDPDVPAGTVRLAPRLPAGTELVVTGIALAGGHLDVRVRGSDVEVLAAPDGLAIETLATG